MLCVSFVGGGVAASVREEDAQYRVSAAIPPLLAGNRVGDLPSRGRRSSCLTRGATSPQLWPSARSRRRIDATTIMEKAWPAVLTSSRSSTWADEPWQSATTVAGTRASFLSARPTVSRTPTAKKPTATNAAAALPGWRRPTARHCDQPHRAQADRAGALRLFSASWLIPTSARTCPAGKWCHWRGSETESRSRCRGCQADHPDRDRATFDGRSSTRRPAVRRVH